jgi:excisionase family DNA binding protein
MNQKLLTLEQVAEYLGVHRDTVYALVRSGRLAALQLGGRKSAWRISEQDLANFIAEGKAAVVSSGYSSLEAFDRRQEDDRKAFDVQQEKARDDFVSRRNQASAAD